MSGFFKTVSSLRQNFFAWLPAIAGREAFAVLEKAGGTPSRRVGAESPEAWLSAATIGAPRHYPLAVGRVTESGLLLSESAYFLCRSALVRNALRS